MSDIEHLQIHIEGLQATLTKRNARIAELEAKVAELKNNPQAAVSREKAYRDGWKACAGHLMDTTRKTALELSKIRKEAWRVYLEGENK